MQLCYEYVDGGGHNWIWIACGEQDALSLSNSTLFQTPPSRSARKREVR